MKKYLKEGYKMLFQSVLISFFTFSMALVISFLIALLIKGIFICIKYNSSAGKKAAPDNASTWKGTPVTSSK